MRESEKVYIESLAWIAWVQVGDRIRDEILRCLEPLAGVPVEKWPKTRIKKWWSQDDMYALPLWDDSDEVFVLFIPKGERIHVQMIYSREKIETISGRPISEMVMAP